MATSGNEENDLLFINGPIKKFVRQQCYCLDSRPIDESVTIPKTAQEFKKLFLIIIKVYKDVCIICGTPYKVWYDTSNCLLVKNIGDENAKPV